MSNINEQERKPEEGMTQDTQPRETPFGSQGGSGQGLEDQGQHAGQPLAQSHGGASRAVTDSPSEADLDERHEREGAQTPEGRPVERRTGARGTAAMDPTTRREVARKGGLAVSRNRQHMSEIGRKGGQSVSKNREHMAKIGRKGGAASRGHHS